MYLLGDAGARGREDQICWTKDDRQCSCFWSFLKRWGLDTLWKVILSSFCFPTVLKKKFLFCLQRHFEYGVRTVWRWCVMVISISVSLLFVISAWKLRFFFLLIGGEWIFLFIQNSLTAIKFLVWTMILLK